MGIILKFLLIGAVILVVWFVVRTRGRINVFQAAVDAARKVAEKRAGGAGKGGPPVKIQDLVRCPKCGNYGPPGRPCLCEAA